MKALLLSAMVVLLASCGVAEQKGLPNTAWLVTNLNMEQGEPIQFGDNAPPTLIFNEVNNEISGNTGCNSFFGDYTVDGDKLTINVVGQSMALCPDADIEARYIDALKNCRTYKIENGALLLMDASGKTTVSFIPTNYPN